MAVASNWCEVYADSDGHLRVRCMICGHSEDSGFALRLDDAGQWAADHECARLAVTTEGVRG